MTKKEQDLIKKGYGIKGKYNTEEVATAKKQDHQKNGFFAQTVPVNENDQKFWLLYVKK